MRYTVLAADYDGTLASQSVVAEETLEALRNLRASGRKLVMVTGRELADLQKIFQSLDLFDRVVAENGAVLYCPADGTTEVLSEPPPQAFLEALRARGVSPLSVGHVIAATFEPHESTVLQTIREFGLEHQVIFNKGAVMVLPAGVNKATGLKKALAELHLSPHNAVGVGDAENDHAFLTVCECAVAVGNALPTLKARADWVTTARNGAGVIELVRSLVHSDLRERVPEIGRHRLPLGHTFADERLTVGAQGTRLLVAGPSGAGKSTIATAFLEQLVHQRYQFCLVDPEGDYTEFPDAIVLGNAGTAPRPEEIADVLRKPSSNVIAVLIGLPKDERPEFLAKLLAALEPVRTETGRPHWLVIDEVHHFLPASAHTPAERVPSMYESSMMITVHPDHVAREALALATVVVAAGANPLATIRAFADRAGEHVPPAPQPPAHDAAVAWFRGDRQAPVSFRPCAPRTSRSRHQRKYAEGTLEPDRSFYFRGPDRKLSLRAQNFELFLQLAEGVDDETWTHHLAAGDYSTWIRQAIKDESLADEVHMVERRAADLSPRDSRLMIAEAINRRYTTAE
ncbi:MAG: HAD-IIB family hydrolase [Acidobacteria bacterium]|nr:HAD-IIB family hydrolase [Acidobacteriota bacterium]